MIVKMPKFGPSIRKLREDAGLSQEAMASRAGISMRTIQVVEQLDAPNVRGTTLRAIARVFGLTPESLEKVWRTGRVPQVRGDRHGGIPILAEVPASNGQSVEGGYDQGIGEDYISRSAVGVTDPLAYALRVKGDSMAPVLVDGDLVICSPEAVQQNGFENGSIYAIRFDSEHDDETTIKRVRTIGNNEIELRPENDRHQTRIVPLSSIVRAAKAIRKLSELM